MGLDHSFDIVSRVDLQEVSNAVQTTVKEIRNRFDFKNSRADIRLDEKEKSLNLSAEDDFKLKGLRAALEEKLARRKVPLRAVSFGRVMDGPNRTVKQEACLQVGIPDDKAREIVKIVKGLKVKAQVAIQGDEVRVSSAKIDVLQQVLHHLKSIDLGIPLQFTNLR